MEAEASYFLNAMNSTVTKEEGAKTKIWVYSDIMVVVMIIIIIS